VRKVARGEAPRGEAPSGEATVLILESGDRKLRTLESDTPPQHVEVARSAAGRRSQGR
jgi:hypothetical protein